MSPEAPPLDLARYAEVMAHLRRFPADKRDEVLARLGLPRGAWEAAAARWTAARDAELASGKTELTARFGAAFAHTRRRLEAQRTSLESLGPLPAANAPAPVPEAPVEAAPPVIQRISAQLAPPQPEAPSFLVQPVTQYAPPAMVTAPPAQPVNLGGTVGVSSEVRSPVLPFVSGVGVAELTMAQYASLRVELQAQPDRAAAILGRYGVPAEGRAALEAHWRARFEADPMLRMEFARAYAAYTAWLRGNPG